MRPVPSTAQGRNRSKHTSLREVAANTDAHEFLVSLLEAIEAEGLKARIYRRLLERRCPTQSE